MAPVGNDTTAILGLLTSDASTNFAPGADLVKSMDQVTYDADVQEQTTFPAHSFASKLLTTLLTPVQDKVHNMTTNLLSPPNMDADDFFIPSFEAEGDEDENILQKFLNNSKVISDLPKYGSLPNTPLSAPELDLVSVAKGDNWTQGGGIHYLGETHTDELAWLIPAVVAAIFVLFLIAYILFYGVKALEMKMMKCCFAAFGCCRPGASSRGMGDETDALTASMHEQTEMRAYNSQSASSMSSNFDLGKFL